MMKAFLNDMALRAGGGDAELGYWFLGVALLIVGLAVALVVDSRRWLRQQAREAVEARVRTLKRELAEERRRRQAPTGVLRLTREDALARTEQDRMAEWRDFPAQRRQRRQEASGQ